MTWLICILWETVLVPFPILTRRNPPYNHTPPPVCPKIWHLSHKLQPLKCADKLVLPEDIQGQAGASEPEPLLLRPGEAGPGPHEAQLRLWLWLRAAAAHCQDDPGPGLTRLTRHSQPAADYCRCCAATVAVTTQQSAADCRPPWHTHTPQTCRHNHRPLQTNNYPELPSANSGDGLGARHRSVSVS